MLAIQGISKARWTEAAAMSSFVVSLVTQALAFTGSPPWLSPKYSPNWTLTNLLLSLYIGLQAWWLIRLYQACRTQDRGYFVRLAESARSMEARPAKEWAPQLLPRNSMDILMPYAPTFVVGNIGTAIWALAWKRNHFFLAQRVVLASTVAHFFSVFFVIPSRSYLPKRKRIFQIRSDLHADANEDHDRLTDILAKLGATVALLYAWATKRMVDDMSAPSLPTLLQSGSIYLLLTIASGPDPTLGTCLLYQLIVLNFGEYDSRFWNISFAWSALVIGAALVVECIMSWRGIRWANQAHQPVYIADSDSASESSLC